MPQLYLLENPSPPVQNPRFPYLRTGKRRPNAYAQHVKAVARSTRLQGAALFQEASEQWHMRGGHSTRHNPGSGGEMIYMNPRRRRKASKRGRRRSIRLFNPSAPMSAMAANPRRRPSRRSYRRNPVDVANPKTWLQGVDPIEVLGVTGSAIAANLATNYISKIVRPPVAGTTRPEDFGDVAIALGEAIAQGVAGSMIDGSSRGKNKFGPMLALGGGINVAVKLLRQVPGLSPWVQINPSTRRMAAGNPSLGPGRRNPSLPGLDEGVHTL